MSRKKFTSEEIDVLKKNLYVKNVSDKSITYTKEFKDYFYREYLNGESPTDTSLIHYFGQVPEKVK